MKIPFVTWATGFDPGLMRHIHRLLFGDDDHPALVETSDLSQTTRLSLVAGSEELAGIALPSDVELNVPGLVYRRVQRPVPILEYGIVWLETPASPFVPAFVDVTRELAEVD